MTDLLTFIEATKGTSLKIEVTSKDLLGVCDATLWHWARSGYLVPVKLGRRVFYRRTDIQRLLNR